MNLSNLQRHWQYAATALGLEVQIPFTLKLNDGCSITAEVLLEGYGAKRGMLIVSEYDTIRKKIGEITGLGYGYSCMSQPKESEIQSLEGFDDILEDWHLITGNENHGA